jgi:hypothetical protein
MGLRLPTPARVSLPAALLLIVIVLAGVSVPAAAVAGTTAPVLRAKVDPAAITTADVVVEDGAPLADADRARLEEAATRLRSQGIPTKFVVVATRPPETPAGEYARQLRQAAGFDGNLLVLFLSPGSLGLASSRVPNADLDAAFAAERPTLSADPVAGTIAVADRLARIAPATVLPEDSTASGEVPLAGTESESGGSGNGSGALAGGLIIAGGVGVGVFALTRARKRKAERFDERRGAMAPLIDALATQVDSLWQEISAGGERAPAAQEHWDEAAQAQLAARERLDRARGEDDLSAARLQLERGLRGAQRARAILDGEPAPDPDAPLLAGLCAFDPSHGRAVDAVPVTTPKGDTADVPACAACGAQLAEGATPDVRRTYRDGRPVPYWAGAGWDRGGMMMPSFGGFLGGMFLADLMFDDHHDVDVHAGDAGGGWDSGADGGDAGDAGDSSGGGDWGGDGGGDWGGGDFGGGDFGGGGDF